jgi:hypothetical protein
MTPWTCSQRPFLNATNERKPGLIILVMKSGDGVHESHSPAKLDSHNTRFMKAGYLFRLLMASPHDRRF